MLSERTFSAEVLRILKMVKLGDKTVRPDFEPARKIGGLGVKIANEAIMHHEAMCYMFRQAENERFSGYLSPANHSYFRVISHTNAKTPISCSNSKSIGRA